MLMKVDVDQVLSCITERRLRLILFPTERCNLRCVYCYQGPGPRRMSPGVVHGVKRLLARRMDALESLELSWFGGEPLLATDLIEEIMAHARGLAASGSGTELTSSMTTNALLLDGKRFVRLLELGVTAYQITFDGPRTWHDRRRLRVNGRGTFDEIWSNLLGLAEVDGDFSVAVRLHVDAENSAALPSFMDRLCEGIGADPRFRLFIRRVSKLGGSHDHEFPFLSDRAADEVMRALRDHARKLGLIVELENDRRSICYAARANSFVIRADGTLNKCTVALDNPWNRVGKLREDGCLDLDAEMMQFWTRGLVSGDVAELECPKADLDTVALARVAPVEGVLREVASVRGNR